MAETTILKEITVNGAFDPKFPELVLKYSPWVHIDVLNKQQCDLRWVREAVLKAIKEADLTSIGGPSVVDERWVAPSRRVSIWNRQTFGDFKHELADSEIFKQIKTQQITMVTAATKRDKDYFGGLVKVDGKQRELRPCDALFFLSSTPFEIQPVTAGALELLVVNIFVMNLAN